MEIKVYNDNGIVKITKISHTGNENSMYSNLKNGECVTIKLDALISYKAEKCKIKNDQFSFERKENSGI